MGTIYNSKINTNGLLIYIDAANKRSFTGTGNTWLDLSGNRRNVSLINTPTFDSEKLGSFDFDAASNEWATFNSPSTLSTFTLEVWFKINTLPTDNKVRAIVTQTYPGTSSQINYSLGYNGIHNNGGWDGRINGGFFNAGWVTTLGFQPTANIWYHTAITANGTGLTQYLNGVFNSQQGYTKSLSSSGSSSVLMRRWDDPDYLDGNLAVMRLYDRALTPIEILNNYNASKGRFL